MKTFNSFADLATANNVSSYGSIHNNDLAPAADAVIAGAGTVSQHPSKPHLIENNGTEIDQSPESSIEQSNV